MLKKLLKLVRSDDMVEQALRQSGFNSSYDLSPRIPANKSKPQLVVNRDPEATLWLEDWSEKDEERLKRDDHHWEGYIS
jgi:hypothetical protein